MGCLLFETIPAPLLGFFSPSEEMLAIGPAALRIIGVTFPLAGFCIIAGSMFQAIGNPLHSLVVSVCRQLVVLLPSAYLLSLSGRLELVWLSFPIAEVVSLTLTAIFLRQNPAGGRRPDGGPIMEKSPPGSLGRAARDWQQAQRNDPLCLFLVFSEFFKRLSWHAFIRLLAYRASPACLSLWERWLSAAKTERVSHGHAERRPSKRLQGPLRHLR